MKKKELPRRLGEIQEADYNPRMIETESMRGLMNSIDEFGDLSGVVVNVTTGNLVSGHQRLKAINADDMEIIIDRESHDSKGTVAWGHFDYDGERFNIRFVEWDEITEKAANLTANNPEIQGQFTKAVNPILMELRKNYDSFDRVKLTLLREQTEKKLKDVKDDQAPMPPDMELQPHEHYDYIVLLFKDTRDWLSACEHFRIKRVNASCGRKTKIGLGRCVDGGKYMNRILSTNENQKADNEQRETPEHSRTD